MQVDVHNLQLDNAPRVALEVARSDSIALMGLTVASAHGGGIVVDSCKHVYLGSSDVAAAGDALLVQASAGAAGLSPGQLDFRTLRCCPAWQHNASAGIPGQAVQHPEHRMLGCGIRVSLHPKALMWRALRRGPANQLPVRGWDAPAVARGRCGRRRPHECRHIICSIPEPGH